MENDLLERVRHLNLSDGFHEVEIDGSQTNISKIGNSLIIVTNNKMVLSASVMNFKN